MEVDQELTDGREVYRVARAIVAARPTERFEEVRARLQGTPPLALREVTYAEAESLQHELRFSRVATRISIDVRARAAAPKSGRALLLVGLGAVLLVAAGGGVITYGVLHGDRAPTPDAEATDPLVVAAPEGPLDSRQVSERLALSTVTVRAGDCLGSGVVIAPGRVITNAHVVCSTHELSVAAEAGGAHDATVTRTDPEMDLAELSAPTLRASPIALGDATTVVRGDPVYVFGNPRGLAFTLTSGVVSHARRFEGDRLLIQVDAPINHGNSGGPLVDAQGRLIGIVTMRIRESDGIGLAVAVNHLYEGFAYVAAPGPQDAWHAMVRELREETENARKSRVDELALSLLRPWLVGARITRHEPTPEELRRLRASQVFFPGAAVFRGGSRRGSTPPPRPPSLLSVEARVVRAGPAHPDLEFVLEDGLSRCSLAPTVPVRWRRARFDPTLGMNQEEWGQLGIQSAVVELSLDPCPNVYYSSAAELVMVGAHAGRERVSLADSFK